MGEWFAFYCTLLGNNRKGYINLSASPSLRAVPSTFNARLSATNRGDLAARGRLVQPTSNRGGKGKMRGDCHGRDELNKEE